MLNHGQLMSERSPEVDITRFTVSDGLSHNSLYALLQDHQGFLWMATANGLQSYDGYTFKVIDPDPIDSTSAGGPNFTWYSSIFEDSKQRLWLGSQGMINQFIRTENRIINFHLKPGWYQNAPVMSIAEDHLGRIWVCAHSHAILRLDETSQRFVHISEDYPDLSEYVSSKYEDQNGTDQSRPEMILIHNHEMWISVKDNGLVRLNMSTGQISEYKHLSQGRVPSLSSDKIKAMLMDSSGTLWIGTENGLNEFDPLTGTVKSYYHDPGNSKSLGSSNIHFLAEDIHGTLHVVTRGGWVNHKLPGQGGYFRRTKLPSTRLYPMTTDRSGILWVGSIDEGLFKLDLTRQKFMGYFDPPGKPSSAFGKHIQAIEEDPGGNFLVAVEHGGIYRVDRVSGTFQVLNLPGISQTSPEYDYIPAILVDQKERLWIAARQNLLRYDLETGELKRFIPLEDDQESLSMSEMNGLFEDSQGRIWAVNDKLNRFNEADGSFTRFDQFEEHQDWYQRMNGSRICEDHQERLWIGSSDRGLIRFNPETGLLKGFLQSKGDYRIALHPVVDRRGRIWYSSGNQGLVSIDPETGQEIQRIGELEGLLHTSIQSMEVDAGGNLWISSHRGLSRFDPDTGQFKHFFKEDGLQSNEFRAFSSHKSATGELLFGGQYGFNLFDPDSINDFGFIPPVVITEMQLVNYGLSDLTEAPNLLLAPYRERIQIAHFQNDFSLSFAAMDFGLPERNRYSYMLENYDKSWRLLRNGSRVEYTNVPPGKYIFKVKGSNRDGVWNPTPARLPIEILAPWWKTWWAYSIYGFILMLIIAILRRYEMNRISLKNQVKIEEAKLLERVEVDRLKSVFFTNISHEFRTPLTLIIGPLKKLIDEASDEKLQSSLNIMHRNASRLLRLINQLLDFSRLEAHQLKLQARQYDIVKFLRGTLMSFHSLAEEKGIRITFGSSEETLALYFDWDMAEKIFSNLLSNAFKFTPDKGQIAVNISTGESPGSGDPNLEYAIIRIRDNGVGIPAEDQQKVFQRFQQVETSLSRGHERSGIGLALTRELVDLHHGEISVKSDIGQGSEFTICFPLGSAHLTTAELMESTQVEDSEFMASPDNLNNELSMPPTDDSELPLILVVEDNSDMRAYIRDVLQSSFRIEEAFDGEIGVKSARDIGPDLIISDLMMPKMDGFELCKRIKSDQATSHIPIILLTAKAEREDRLEGLELGADDYLIKPFDSRELKIRITNLIEQRLRLRAKFASSIRVEPRDITVSSRDAQFLQKAMNLVEENMDNEAFSVELFSEMIGLSRRQFYQKIKAITGFTPTDFILNMRLKRAAFAIKEKSGTISEIAYSVGFNNLSYFARAFKKQFGTTPSKYGDSKTEFDVD